MRSVRGSVSAGEVTCILLNDAPRSRTVTSANFLEQIGPLISQVACCDAPVLLQGETGVGKEVVAKEIHARSARAKKPFVKVNCAALPSELIESELFGYQRGAFTGAFRDQPGRFEMANEGTLLLDEVGDMDFSLQAKLLQVLQDGEFHRLGTGQMVKVDVRIMAATHQNLKKAMREGRFREDLFYRLNVINIPIPPLRERKGEILSLAEHFLAKHAPADVAPPTLPSGLQDALLSFAWPGNIRELENVMRRYLVLQDPVMLEDELRLDSPSPEPTPATSGSASVFDRAERVKQAAEREAVLAALTASQWNRTRAAALLKIDYKALLYKMKKLGIASERPSAKRPGSEPAPARRASNAS